MKKFLGTFSASVTYLTAVAPVLADITDPTGGKSNVTTLSSFFNLIIPAIFGIAAFIAVIFLIWGGIKWVMSGGDKAAVEGARNTIIAAIVGILIVGLTFVILNIVLKLFVGVDIFTIGKLLTI